MVVNVEYRMGPEHKFPACYTDAEAVVRWALDNKQELANNSSAIVGVAGDSAGANLSASVCHIVNGLAYQVTFMFKRSDQLKRESNFNRRLEASCGSNLIDLHMNQCVVHLRWRLYLLWIFVYDSQGYSLLVSQ